MLSRFKIIPITLILLLIFLQYRLWCEAGGVLDMFHLKKQLTTAAEQNAKLKKRNDDLLRQVQYLQANQDAVESRARQELGMIKKGETFYQVVK